MANYESLKEIIEGVKNNNLMLPHFQREYVWNKTQQKNLILSVLSGLPASSSLLLEERNVNYPSFSCIKIGTREVVTPSNKDLYYILDGQQRITTLYNTFSNFYDSLSASDNVQTYNNLDNKIRKRWYLKFTDDKNYLFGLNNLHFDEEIANEFLPDDYEDFLDYDEVNQAAINKSSTDDINDVINDCSEKYRIPLFLYKTNKKFKISELLKNIANKRKTELKTNSTYKSDLVAILNRNNIPNAETLSDDFYNEVGDAIETVEDVFDNDNEIQEWSEKVRDYLEDRILNYKISPILLDNTNKAVKTFEYINTGGTNLSTFDLLCAKATNIDLRKVVINYTKTYNNNSNNQFSGYNNIKDEFGLIWEKDNEVISKVYADYLFQVLNILHFKDSGKNPLDPDFNENLQKAKYSLDKLDSTFLINHYKEAVEIILNTSFVLNTYCFHKDYKSITNKLSLLPFFTYFAYANNNNITQADIDKIIAFFWITLFSGSYNSHQSSNAKDNAAKLYDWLINMNGSVKTNLHDLINNKVLKVQDFADKIMMTTQSCNKSVESNLFRFLASISNPFYDWDTNNSELFPSDDIDIHHIIPLGTATTIGQSSKELRKDKNNLLNATMNKTPISSTANKKIGVMSLNQYNTSLNSTAFACHHITNAWFNTNTNKSQLFEARFDAIYNAALNYLNGKILSR